MRGRRGQDCEKVLVCVDVDPCQYVQYFKHIHNLHGVELWVGFDIAADLHQSVRLLRVNYYQQYQE